MIQSIRFENFKVFEELDVKLAPLTGIVGPNASGKTSILEGIFFASLWVTSQQRYNCRILDHDGQQVHYASQEIQVRRRRNTIDTALGFSVPGGEATYTLKGGDLSFRVDGGSIYDFETRLLKLSASNLRKPASSSDLIPTAKPDGEGFAPALAFLALNQPEVYSELQNKLREVIPAVRRVRFAKSQIKEWEALQISGSDEIKRMERTRLGESLLFDMVGADSITASLISEGTLLVLAILYYLSTISRPALILLDDLDHGLHPKAQRNLIGLIRKIMNIETNIQFVFTTHSPYLLDNLAPHEVLLTTLRENGTAACGSLTEHPDFEQWKDEMRPGEMWSFFGEDWVATLDRNKVK